MQIMKIKETHPKVCKIPSRLLKKCFPLFAADFDSSYNTWLEETYTYIIEKTCNGAGENS